MLLCLLILAYFFRLAFRSLLQFEQYSCVATFDVLLELLFGGRLAFKLVFHAFVVKLMERLKIRNSIDYVGRLFLLFCG